MASRHAARLKQLTHGRARAKNTLASGGRAVLEFHRGIVPDNEVANGMSLHEVTGIHEAHVTPAWGRVESRLQLVFDEGGLVGGGGNGVNNWDTSQGLQVAACRRSARTVV